MNPLVQVQLNRFRSNLQTLVKRHEEALYALEDERKLSAQRQKSILQQTQELNSLELNEKEYGHLQSRLKLLEDTQARLRVQTEKLANLAAALAESLSK